MEQNAWIERTLQPYREQLNNHKLYDKLSSIEDIQAFMEYHVYAVWDFMSLLKSLQIQLTCTTVPWVPSRTPETARFINEIVLGEESDEDEDGRHMSHFEMYLNAMDQAGASTLKISQFMELIRAGEPVDVAADKLRLDPAITNFMRFTFNVINSQKPHLIASAFTFGREDLIPDMFLAIVKQAEENDTSASYSKLTYYLNRHIELDGDDHGPLALQMIAQLCGEDEQKWKEVVEVAQEALQQRIYLWDAIAEEIGAKTEKLSAEMA